MLSKILTRSVPWLLLGALALAGLQTYRLASEQTAHARTQRDHAQQMATLERTGREAETDARAEDARRFTALWEITNATQTQLEAVRADAAAASDVAGRLRQRVAAITAGCRRSPDDPGSAVAGEATRSDPDLLADVLGEMEIAGRELAEETDRRGIAGRACERAYDVLNESAARLH
ncbi:DUF2514 domain-containing protein [Methyloversatilis sp. XJ19-49]|uniref:DUF2514 domain-containing protein n=1 Tax=Methyloversatilis sp. XJ19-49 TaxID=2963429 RepID=UPI00211C9894|nr:DUF2514 domain-containing protein [Methyloversatilis sp. XJ19-49]MCQ9378789.1 DUF2514 domain-containing protein [Methyloversatilis sp. XJ19-49]